METGYVCVISVDVDGLTHFVHKEAETAKDAFMVAVNYVALSVALEVVVGGGNDILREQIETSLLQMLEWGMQVGNTYQYAFIPRPVFLWGEFPNPDDQWMFSVTVYPNAPVDAD